MSIKEVVIKYYGDFRVGARVISEEDFTGRIKYSSINEKTVVLFEVLVPTVTREAYGMWWWKQPAVILKQLQWVGDGYLSIQVSEVIDCGSKE